MFVVVRDRKIGNVICSKFNPVARYSCVYFTKPEVCTTHSKTDNTSDENTLSTQIMRIYRYQICLTIFSMIPTTVQPHNSNSYLHT